MSSRLSTNPPVVSVDKQGNSAVNFGAVQDPTGATSASASPGLRGWSAQVCNPRAYFDERKRLLDFKVA